MITFCEGHKTMREQGLQFVDTVKKLLQLLLAYRAVVKDENQENKMSCTVNLLVCVYKFVHYIIWGSRFI